LAVSMKSFCSWGFRLFQAFQLMAPRAGLKNLDKPEVGLK